MKKNALKFFITAFGLILVVLYALTHSYCWSSETDERAAWTSVKTFAGIDQRFGEPYGVAVRNGEIYVSDGEHGKIWRVGKDGSKRIFAENLDTPSQIAFDEKGNLFVADSGTHTIKKISPDGAVELFAGVENQKGFADGEAKSALFNAPVGIAVSGEKVFVADTYNDRIRVVENGVVSTIAGSEKGFAEGIGIAAKFDTPLGLASWSDGRVLIADTGNRRIRVVEPSGGTWTLTGTGESNLKDGFLHEASFVQPTAVAVDETGAIFIADGNAVRAIGRRIFPFVETISAEKRGLNDGAFGAARFNRPSGLAFDEEGNLFVADSENQLLRIFTGSEIGRPITSEEIKSLRYSPEEFRGLGTPRWTYDPPENKREIAGTLGEIRGEIKGGGDDRVWFHNGLDIVGAYGETARFIRDEKVLRPFAAENFGTLRELLRMPTIGYIHIRLGRDRSEKTFDDPRFQFERGADGKLTGVRVPRGAKFRAGEPVGTLNAMNHVHLIAGASGAEMNALDALVLPGASDTRQPTIEDIALTNENWKPFETENGSERIKISGKTRVVVRAYDQMDGNSDRRRLGVYKIGYQVLQNTEPLFEPRWTISFARFPDPEAVKFVYAPGSRSGATGETIFRYIATNEVNGDFHRENFLDAADFAPGVYTLRVFAADFFGNTASKDVTFEIVQ